MRALSALVAFLVVAAGAETHATTIGPIQLKANNTYGQPHVTLYVVAESNGTATVSVKRQGSVLASAIALATPGVVTAFTVVASFGGHPTSNELTYVEQMLTAVQAYVDPGKAHFSTTQPIYDAIRALE